MDWHTHQLDGSPCASYNCAACSGAMGLYWQTAETITGAQFRAESAESCVPGVHSGSGGLYISDVIRVYGEHGATIDYGQLDAPPGYTRWAASELGARLRNDFGGVILGDYDALPVAWRAQATFRGDHSTWVHDYRVVLGVEETHWHDPLRMEGIWIPLSAVISYWQKPSSPICGYAGWVKLIAKEEDLDPKVDIPIGRCNVSSGGTVYANPQKTAVLIAQWVGASGVQVYSQRPGLTAIRIDLQSGTATDLRIGWIGNDKVTVIGTNTPPLTVTAAKKEAAGAVKQAAVTEAAKYGA